MTLENLMRARTAERYAVGVILLCAGVAGATDPVASRPAGEPGVWIRASQIGYLPGDPKIAILSSDEPQSGSFSVGDFSGSIGEDQGAWGPFRHNYRLDFTDLTRSGRYQVRFGRVESLPFTIGDHAYADVPEKLLSFMRLQRCGDNPVTGRKCHQQDAIDTIDGRKVGLVGGWHDAADRLKHMITTTYCVAALFLARADGEARYGAELVRKIHPDAETIYVQIGDDRDHSPPATLWHDDQSDYGWGKGGPRSAWRATGKPEGPRYQNKSSGMANLAGRASAAMTLAGDLKTAVSMYELARRHPGNAMSVPVKAPHYYGESTYLDDMEWAATELFIATKEPKYLTQAIEYARQVGPNAWMGKLRHGHYEFFPYVNLAHWRLYPYTDADTKKRLADDYRVGLESVRQIAEKNPYRLGTPLVWCSTNDVVALATQAVLYEKMTGDRRYRVLAAEARDWIFGRNPWGVSMVIGVPEKGNPSRHPHHRFFSMAKILPVGGLVDGPVYKGINDSLKFDSFGDDAYARFQSDVGVYHDGFADFSTNEPIIDGTVSLLLLLQVWQ
jgi:endoglucanase